jgi:histidine triad (HIT) family protein
MNDCIFRKISRGEIPSATVYEDNDFRVIMDISPASEGHMIILPKEHAANVYELSDNIASKIYVLAKKLAVALKEELDCDGVNILQNNEEAAGQTVFHLHMHIIPRYFGDDINIKWNTTESKSESLEELAKQIGQRIN